MKPEVWIPILLALTGMNAAGFAGLMFHAGRFVRRVEDMGARVKDLEDSKMEVNLATLTQKVDHLGESMIDVREHLRVIADFLMMQGGSRAEKRPGTD